VSTPTGIRYGDVIAPYDTRSVDLFDKVRYRSCSYNFTHRVNVEPGNQHESPFVGSGMGKFYVFLAAVFTDHDDIDVQGAWPVGDRAFPSKTLFYGEGPIQQGHRFQGGFRHHHEVQVVILFWPFSHEGRLVDGGNVNDNQIWGFRKHVNGLREDSG